jgi:D-alanyl-D-alanine dipeptidase
MRVSLTILEVVLAAGFLAACASDSDLVRVTPPRPLAELKAEALSAQPPVEPPAKHQPDLIDLGTLDPTIRFDIRYATTDNFLGEPIYAQARAFLQRPAAEALLRAHRALNRVGYGLLIHDAYRPWWVTKVFWEATPPEQRAFVADPDKGSRHNRGCAVDLTLYRIDTGQAVQMPGLYDEMSTRSYPTYTGGTERQRALRDLLRVAMETAGFEVFELEWWHFDYAGWRDYPIMNVDFEGLGP